MTPLSLLAGRTVFVTEIVKMLCSKTSQFIEQKITYENYDNKDSVLIVFIADALRYSLDVYTQLCLRVGLTKLFPCYEYVTNVHAKLCGCTCMAG